MKKPHLVLINGFGSNGKIIKGALDLFRRYFNVHFLELPGSVKNIKLKNYNFIDFVNYFQDKIDNIKYKEYILGSLSFGFTITNKLMLNKKCKGIFAVEPFIDYRYSTMPIIERTLWPLFTDIICFLRLYDLIWKAKWFKKILQKAGYSDTIIQWIQTLDSEAWFKTAKILAQHKDKIQFQKLPHVLIINKNDGMINANKTIKVFKEKTKNLKIILSTIPHYPEKMNKLEIAKKINTKELSKMKKFFFEI